MKNVMKRKNRKDWFPWLAVVLWMAVIFLFSAQTGDRSGDTSGQLVRWLIGLLYKDFTQLPLAEQTKILDIAHLLIRKGAHFTEYAVLAMLTANALRKRPLSTLGRWLIPVGVCALYALTDELHQYFVPERACRFLDVCIDTAGGICGVAVSMLLRFVRKTTGRKR